MIVLVLVLVFVLVLVVLNWKIKSDAGVLAVN